MATSASAFAAQLTDDLRASAPACTVVPQDNPGGTCGRPGGPARATCHLGHVESYTSCPDCATYAVCCWKCFIATGDNSVPLTITTEVA